MGATADAALPGIVRAHAERCWPARTLEVLRWEEGGLVENLPDLAVIRVAPGPSGGPATLLTAGASVERLDDGYGLELILLAPAGEPAAIKLLTMVAHLHADPRYPLSLGQVLEIGHPWLPGAVCDHLLVSLVEAFEPQVEWYSDRERNIRFIWLVPMTRAEADFAREHGPTALLEKLGAAGVDAAALERVSAV